MLLPCFMDHKFSVTTKDYLLAKGLSSNFSIKNCRGQKFPFSSTVFRDPELLYRWLFLLWTGAIGRSHKTENQIPMEIFHR